MEDVIKALYVDDEDALLDIGKIFLERSGETIVDIYPSVKEADKALHQRKYDAIISDYQMPEMNGIEFLKKLRSENNAIPFILFTGKGREEVVIEAFNSGANFYLQKGGNPTTQFAELEHHLKEAVFKKRAEEEAQISNLKLKVAMDLAHVGFWSLDLSTMMMELDDQFWKILGTSAEKEGERETTLPILFQRFIHPNDIPLVNEELGRARKPPFTSSSKQMGLHIIRVDGQTRRVLLTYVVSQDPKNDLIKAFGALQDITDHIKNEVRLAQLNRGLVAIKEINKAIIRARTEIEMLNDVCRIACDIAGYRVAWVGSPEDDDEKSIKPVAWTGISDDDVNHIDVSWSKCEGAHEPTGEAMRTGRSVAIQDWTKEPQMRAWRKVGLKYGCKSSIALPIISLTEVIGTLTLFSGTVCDFTAEEIELLEEMVHDLAHGITNIRSQEKIKIAEQSLKESEERYRTIFHGTAAGMSLSHLNDGTYLEVNSRWLEMNGFDRDQMVGVTSYDINIWLKVDDRRNLVHELMQNGSLNDKEVTFRRKNGDIWTSLLSAEIIKIGGEDLILSTYLDITERQRTEEALAEAHRKLNLLSSITIHDIRNKLTVLQSNLSLMEKNNNEMANKRLYKAMAASESISAIIDFAKEYEEIGINTPMWFNVHELVEYCREALLNGNVKIENHVPVTFEIFADPMIRKVFSNLIDNSIRHGGLVTTVRFFIEKRNDRDVLVCSDDGFGIALEMKKNLFMRGCGSDHGLGLYLSREILAITGITITEEGTRGYGAKFVMTFLPNGMR